MSYDRDNWTLKSRWVMRRNRILGSAAFQRWASRTPIIRGIARRRAAVQFDLVAGFVYSQILSAYVTSGLIGFLNGRLRSLEDILDFVKLGAEATDRLLRAGQSLQLIESPQAGLWTLGEAGAPLSANDGAMAMIRHHHLLYRDLANPLKLLADNREKQTALSAYWTYASRREGEGDTASYSALMAATQPMVSQQIIDAYAFAQHRRMLDIGGGTGAFARAISAVAPDLELGIFDLPDVLDGASDSGFAHHPGSFKTTPLPSGYDLITLVRILHDHDDDVAQALLASIHAALPDGGQLLIVEPMAESPHAVRMGDAYFGLYLWAMGSGRPRSASTIADMLKTAGFSSVSAVKTALPIITSALVAKK
jgi:demethylspheroidene O-methyltransferase